MRLSKKKYGNFFLISLIISSLFLASCGKIEKQSIEVRQTEKTSEVETEQTESVEVKEATPDWIEPGSSVEHEFVAIRLKMPENWEEQTELITNGKSYTFYPCEDHKKAAIIICEYLSQADFEKSLETLPFVDKPEVEHFLFNGPNEAARTGGYVKFDEMDYPIYMDILLFRQGKYLYTIDYVDYTEDTSVWELKDYEDVLFNTIIPKTRSEMEAAEEVLIYSDDSVDIIYAGKEDSIIKFKVKNKLDQSITVYPVSLAVDGISSDDIDFYTSIAPQSIGTIEASCPDFRNVAKPSVLSGDFRIMCDDFMTSFNAVFSNVDVNNQDKVYAYSANIQIPDGAEGMQYTLTGPNGEEIVPETMAENPQTNDDGSRYYSIYVDQINNISEGRLYITWILPDGSTQHNATYPVIATFTRIQ